MTTAQISSDAQTMIGQRRARSLATARSRSRFVSGVRFALIIAAVLVALNAAVQIIRSSGHGEITEPLLQTSGGAERIINPRFTGRDESGVPFVITADTAERRIGGSLGEVDLTQPTLDYALLDGDENGSRVLADRGIFNELEQSLTLIQSVRLSTRSGYVFETNSATLYLREGAIIGTEPVLGLAPWGGVRADGFEVRDEGADVSFTGDVRTRINAPEQALEAENEPSEETEP